MNVRVLPFSIFALASLPSKWTCLDVMPAALDQQTVADDDESLLNDFEGIICTPLKLVKEKTVAKTLH